MMFSILFDEIAKCLNITSNSIFFFLPFHWIERSGHMYLPVKTKQNKYIGHSIELKCGCTTLYENDKMKKICNECSWSQYIVDDLVCKMKIPWIMQST